MRLKRQDKECSVCHRIFSCPLRKNGTQYSISLTYWERRQFCSQKCSNSVNCRKSAELRRGTKQSRGLIEKRIIKLRGRPRPKFSDEWLKNLSESHKGLPSPTKGMKFPNKSGFKHWRWKGGYENKLMHSRNRRIIKLKAEGSHTLSQWEEMKRKFKYRCPSCKQEEPLITLTGDHIIPLSKGGSNYISNIQPLCRSCNSRKSTKTKYFVYMYS